MNVIQYTPEHHEEKWNRLVDDHPAATPYHTRAWARVIQETFYFEEKSIVCVDDTGVLRALLPLWKVNRKELINAPWRDKADILALDDKSWHAISSYLASLNYDLVLKDWSANTQLENFRLTNYWVNSELDLSQGIDAIWKEVNKNLGRNLRKAEKCGIIIKQELAEISSSDFYELFKKTRKRLGVPIFPFRLFKNMWNYMGEQTMRVYMAYLDNRPICGFIVFDTPSTSLYAYGASDFLFQETRVNDLIMWKAIEDSLKQGKKIFDFGCDAPDNFNLMRFKKKWGAVPKNIVTAYKTKRHINPAKEDFSSGYYKSHRRVLKMMPAWFLVFLGDILSRKTG